MRLDRTDRLASIIRLAPAKLNLTLAILGLRPDGFHALHSVMVPLALADRLSFSLAPVLDPGGRDSLHVIGFDTGPIEHNLVLRAIAATRGAVSAGRAGAGGPPPALAARLEKRIPVAAGLAGGSRDAAAAIDGALETWAASLDPMTVAGVAAALGSDVPFFLAGGAALVEGRGERVTPLRGRIVGGPPGILLVTPAVAVPTLGVFAAFAAGARPPDPGATLATSRHLAAELAAGLSASQLAARAGVLAVANDLIQAAAVVVPELAPFRRSLARLIGRPVGQSGSGPSLWAIYPSRGEAEAAARAVLAALDDRRLEAPGDAPPFVAATTILAHDTTTPGRDP